MKNSKTFGSKLSSILSGKGFYVVLCVSILAVGVASYYAYTKTIDNLNNELSNTSTPDNSSNKIDWGFDDAQNVNKDKDDVPKDTSATTTTAPKSNQAQANTQPKINPVNGKVLNPFSLEMVKSKTLGCFRIHEGVDYSGAIGDAVKSMTSGTVKEITDNTVWGVTITIDHGNGVVSTYSNLNKVVLVKVGDKVSAGTVIGSIGNTAAIEELEDPHLHFTVKKNGEWVDPIAYIKS